MPQFRDYMKNVMDDSFNVSYYHTFNNENLIHLFRVHASKAGSVSVVDAINIIVKWLDNEVVKQENVSGLFRTLNIPSSASINFEQLAKLATVLSSYLATEQKTERKPIAYSSLRMTSKRVVYRENGVIEAQATNLVDGAAKGCVEALRKTWHRQGSRVFADIPRRQVLQFSTALQSLPDIFGFSKPLTIPSTWSYRDSTWCRPDSVIRVGREILSQRFDQQQLLYGLKPLDQEQREFTLTPISELLRMFYEKLYGAEQLTIAQNKIFQYLESCIQLDCFPILNILKNLVLVGTPLSQWTPSSATLLCELRGILIAKDLVSSGRQFDFSDFGAGACPECHHVISKHSAIQTVVDLLKFRGGFGPLFIQSIVHKIELLPTVDGQEEQNIDMEVMLEAVVIEYQTCRHYLEEVSTRLFHNPSDSTAIMASSFPHPFNHSFVLIMLRHFIRRDINRYGVVSKSVFFQVLTHLLETHAYQFQPILGNFGQLSEECIRRFSNYDGLDHNICYADFFAILLGWLDVVEYSGAISVDILLDAVRTTKIGIDHNKANLLLDYLCLASPVSMRDPMWIFSQSESYKISTKGDFNLESTLFDQSNQLHATGQRALVRNSSLRSTHHVEPINTVPIESQNPHIVPTLRPFFSLHGEICQRVELEQKEKPLIRKVVLGTDHPADQQQQQHGDSANARSYSRSISALEVRERESSLAEPAAPQMTQSRSLAALETRYSERSAPRLETLVRDASENVRDLHSAEALNKELLMKEREHTAKQRLAKALLRGRLTTAPTRQFRKKRSSSTNLPTARRSPIPREVSVSASFETSKENLPPSLIVEQAVDLESNSIVSDDQESLPSTNFASLSIAPSVISRTNTNEKTASVVSSTVITSSTSLAVTDIIAPSPRVPSSQQSYSTPSPLVDNTTSLPLTQSSNEVSSLIEVVEEPEPVDKPIDDTAFDQDQQGDDINVDEAPMPEIEMEVKVEGEAHTEELENAVVAEVEDNNEYGEGEEEGEGEGEGEVDEEGEDEGDGEEGDGEGMPSSTTVTKPPIPLAPPIFSNNETIERAVKLPTNELSESMIKKIQKFVGTLDRSCEMNIEHPRRPKSQVDQQHRLFLPQMFGSDISFDAFDAPAYSLIEESDAAMSAEDHEAATGKSDFFSDINAAVKAHKKLVARKRVEQLYSTSDSEIRPEEWTKMYVKGIIDWRKFFDERKIGHDDGSTKQPPPPAVVLPPLYQNTTCDIEPLQNNRVRDLVQQRGEIRYFQVNICCVC